MTPKKEMLCRTNQLPDVGTVLLWDHITVRPALVVAHYGSGLYKNMTLRVFNTLGSNFDETISGVTIDDYRWDFLEEE